MVRRLASSAPCQRGVPINGGLASPSNASGLGLDFDGRPRFRTGLAFPRGTWSVISGPSKPRGRVTEIAAASRISEAADEELPTRVANPDERTGLSGTAVTAEQLFAWRIEYARAVRKQLELDEYVKVLAARIESVQIAGRGAVFEKPHGPPRRRVRGKRAGTMNLTEAPRMKSSSWTETVYQVVVAADRLMTMDELRDSLGKVRKLEKAWISGVLRLKDSGHIVSYKWRIGTPAARQRFLEDVANG